MNMFVFDSHAHIIPPLAGASGYESIEEHLIACQRAMHEHLAQPARRVRDNAIVEKQLWDPKDPSPKGRCDVKFRVGAYGRFVWEQDGEEIYIQYLPPYAERMELPLMMLKAQMEYANVDAAVLQCANVYGKLNAFYKSMVKEHPWTRKVLYPLARIEEARATTPTVLNELEDLFSDGLLAGLWFAGDQTHFTSAYDIFWEKVRELGILVFILFYPDRNWVHTFKHLGRWSTKFADIGGVLAQAFPLSTKQYDDKLTIPSYTVDVIRNSSLFIELVYPIGRGPVEAYPYPKSLDAVKCLYDSFGPDKLVWGSDMPMVERYCTYSQSLEYLLQSDIGINSSDMQQIVGSNLQSLFKGK